MQVEQQLSIFLDNRPGVLAAVCRDLAAHGINIDAVTVANVVDHAVVRMVVSDPRAAVHLLGARGVLVILSDVLAIELPDEPGSMEELALRLGRAKINIDYMYGSSRGNHTGWATLFVRVADVRKARRALASLKTAPGRRQRPRTGTKRAKARTRRAG